MNLQKKHIHIAVIIFATSIMPVFAADGDGSNTDNSDLLRDGFISSCYDLILCEPVVSKQKAKITKTNVTVASYEAIDLVPDISSASLKAALIGKNYQVGENYNASKGYQISPSPAIIYDWSLSLRGAFIKDYNGDRFEIITSPNVSLSYKNRNSSYNIGASADLSKQFEGDDYRLAGVNLNFNSEFILNKETKAAFGSNLNLDQLSINDLSSSATTALAPISIIGRVDGSISRRFGLFTGELRGAIARNVYGSTKLVDNSWQDNSAQNNTSFEVALRGSQEITPILSIFADARVNRNIYDSISSTLNVSQDNNSYALRGGIVGRWGEMITAQASVGYGLRQYNNAVLAEVPSMLLDASLNYENGNGLNLEASFSNNISGANPNLGASTKLDYITSLKASYQINEWLKARANIAAGWAYYIDIADIERTISAGIGADYKLNKQTSLSADYSYNSLETTILGKRDSHRVELGVTFSR